MQVTIQPAIIQGVLTAPPSKSAMQRACAAALLSSTISYIYNPGTSNDDIAALNIIQQLGATVVKQATHIVIDSNNALQNLTKPLKLDCKESGLSIRMFTPIAALLQIPVIIDGSGSLSERPMDFFEQVLPQLGVQIKTNKGKLPLEIQGPLVPTDIIVDGSLSSQFLTGLLMAYAATNTTNTTIKVRQLKSKPYIDLTLQMMQLFGLNQPTHQTYQAFTFSGNKAYKQANIHYTVEGDWSGAAFLLVAAATAGSITVKGLDLFSEQADKAILQALTDCNCRLSIQSDQIEVSTISQLKPFHFNATDCPDLFPPLVALAASCKGTSVIEGVHRLTHKESNRAATLMEVFGKMGIEIKLQNDLMLVNGGTGIQAATVSSHHDHRIAMAASVAALNANGTVTIQAAEAIEKSYPQFYHHLQQAGAAVEIVH
jgi:3-phosphoshikimate 1-carboxyvinyltransferase